MSTSTRRCNEDRQRLVAQVLHLACRALEEIADFLASGPSPDELLQFRPVAPNADAG